MTDLNRRGNCEVLGIRVDRWSERTSTDIDTCWNDNCCIWLLDVYRYLLIK